MCFHIQCLLVCLIVKLVVSIDASKTSNETWENIETIENIQIGELVGPVKLVLKNTCY